MEQRLPLLFLLAGDLVLSLAAVSAAFGMSGEAAFGDEGDALDYGVRVALFAAVMIVSSFFVELYSMERALGRKEAFVRVLTALVISFFVLSAGYYLIPSVTLGRGVLLFSLLVFGALQFLWRIGYRQLLSISGFARRVLILGTGPLANQIGSVLSATNQHYILTGYVTCPSEPVFVPAHTIVGNDSGLAEAAKLQRAHKIVISLSERRGVFPYKDVLSCKFSGIEVVDAPSFYEQVTGKLLIENILPSWFIFSSGFRITFFKKAVKRVFDIAFSVAGLAAAAPLFPLIAAIIKIDSPGPVFFRQTRVGRGERDFVLYKFRTMRSDAEQRTGAVWAQKDDPRVTKAGRILRKSRLDELPQLYNVLKGDMAFVGPRPERPEFVEKLKRVIPYYSERHSIKPGVTGWAQIKYPYGASVEDAIEKLRYDLFYIKHLSLFLDLLIILETIKVVLFGRGGR